MELKFFEDVPATLAYLTDELVATLNDDANQNRGDVAEEETVADLEARVADIEAVTPLVLAAPDMLAALEGLFEHCAMVHKYWGEGANGKEADAAQAAARAAIVKAKS